MLNFLQNGKCSFIFTTFLYIQPMLPSPAKSNSSNSVSFNVPITPLVVHKIILAIATNTPFLCTSAIFCLLLFVYNHPNNLQQNIFPTSTISPFQVVSRDQGAGESEGLHFFDLSILLQSMDSENRAHNH